jgi:hypothetical protein
VGEFTRLFQAAPTPGLPRQANEPVQAPQPPSYLDRATPTAPSFRASPAEPASEPGELTRMLQGMPRPPEAPPPAAEPDESLAALRLPEQRRVDLPSASPSLPGLNLHQGPAQVEPPSPAGAEAAGPSPAPPALGEFTSMFGSPRQPGHPGAQLPPPPTAPPAAGPSAYGAQPAPPHPPVSPPPFAPAAPPPGAPYVPGIAPQNAATMGEYTRMISAQKPPPAAAATPAAPPRAPAPAAPQPVADPGAASAGTPWSLIIGLILVIVLLMGLLLYFVLATPSQPALPEAPEAAEIAT